MAEVVINEHNELIATRVPPGDRWKLVDDPKNIVHPNLTETLEAYLHKTGFQGEYRLDPMNSRLYAIHKTEEEVKPKEEKMYSLYGEFRQGV
jgi:hypothetical protein|tara:strand:+ start:93 stop:368 length:276 start_codon:yes stop_codon:yes gene_type:complete